MDNIQKTKLLKERLAELELLSPDWRRAEFKQWDERTKVTLRSVCGLDSQEFVDFDAISFNPRSRGRSGDANWSGAFNRGRVRAAALLQGILYGLEILNSVEQSTSSEDIYPPLWGHVEASVTAENWPIVASQSAIFLEDQLRQWTGADADIRGIDLATVALHRTQGQFPMGATDGEQDGWHLLAMGFFQALSNPARHRIDQMGNNPRAYALGVLATASLILSQIAQRSAGKLTSKS